MGGGCYHAGRYNGAPTDGSAWIAGDCTRRIQSWRFLVQLFSASAFGSTRQGIPWKPRLWTGLPCRKGLAMKPAAIVCGYFNGKRPATRYACTNAA